MNQVEWVEYPEVYGQDETFDTSRLAAWGLAIAPVIIGGIGGYLISRGYFKGVKEEKIAKTTAATALGIGLLGSVIAGLTWEVTRK